MKVHQTDFGEYYDEIGVCIVEIKYSIDEEDQVSNLIQNNHKYLFSNPELTIGENLDPIFVLNGIKNHCIIKMSS